VHVAAVRTGRGDAVSATMIDVERARSETPGCQHVNHLNNAGASLMPEPVLRAVIDHLELEAKIGGYEAAARQEDAWQHTYDSLATLINCHRDEVAVVENATRAWDMAFYGLRFATGDRILTSAAEYGSNYLAYLQTTSRTGVSVEVVPSDEHGEVSLDALADMLDERVKLVAITHVPTNGGLVNPVEGVGEITRQADVPFLLDACQSVGQMPLDIERIGCDVLAATGRKFLRGPRGTGFLYVRRELLQRVEPPFIDVLSAEWTSRNSYRWRSDARRFESWETNYATKIGLGAAVDYALQWGLEEIRDYNYSLAAQLRARLRELPQVEVLDLGRAPCSVVTFTIAGRDPKAVARKLSDRRINVSVSTLEDTRLDMEARGHASWVRASVHYFNTEKDITELADAVQQMAESAGGT
jgi:cysteine desulfurase / selenocysteine lyase